MGILFIVSLIWAFSFGLIKDQLTGVDANFIAAARLLISMLVFLPFIRPGRLPNKLSFRLLFIGSVQYGVMYITYIASFRFLAAYEVALFTIFTPIYVTLFNDLFARRLTMLNLLTASLAVVGTGVISFGGLGARDVLSGFLLVQISNLCFAFGQVAYQRWMGVILPEGDLKVFGLLYLGGFITAALAATVLTPWRTLTLRAEQVWTLLYLGSVASGLGFFLWNYAARRVETGTLAIFNDLKVPLAVAVSLLFFGEKTDPLRLLIGGLLCVTALVVQLFYTHGKRNKNLAPSENQQSH
jgi:drug/metabolite transporter (DMT)-like permease